MHGIVACIVLKLSPSVSGCCPKDFPKGCCDNIMLELIVLQPLVVPVAPNLLETKILIKVPFDRRIVTEPHAIVFETVMKPPLLGER